MKKLSISILFALMTITTANAQNFGVKGGLNISSLSGEDVEDFDAKTGFHFGVVAEFMLSEAFAVQPELLFSTRGASVSEDGDDYSLNLNYITLPLLAKFYPVTGFSIEGGVLPAFNISAKEKYNDESADLENIKNFDFGAAIGAGYVLPSGLFFQARYNFGLSEIVKDVDAQNRVMQLSIGYLF